METEVTSAGFSRFCRCRWWLLTLPGEDRAATKLWASSLQKMLQALPVSYVQRLCLFPDNTHTSVALCPLSFIYKPWH